MYRIVKQSDAIHRQINSNKSALNYITKEITSNFSVATTEGINCDLTETTEYDRVYFVLSGKLKLIFDLSKKEILLNPNDAVFISKETSYRMIGTFSAVVINQPAFGS